MVAKAKNAQWYRRGPAHNHQHYHFGLRAKGKLGGYTNCGRWGDHFSVFRIDGFSEMSFSVAYTSVPFFFYCHRLATSPRFFFLIWLPIYLRGADL